MRGGHLVLFWAMLSPHIATHRHRSTSSKRPQGIASGCLSSFPTRPLPCPSLLSVALTVHTIARSSLPSSSAVPVILRPDLVRSLSFLPTGCQANASRSLSHQFTPSPWLEGFTPSGSCRDTISPPLHRPAIGTGGPLPDLLPASPSGRW